jgi:Fe-S-cluster containining protein
VPISPAEAVRLAEVVEAMPEERRAAVKQHFAGAVKKLEERGLLDRRAPRGRAALVSAKKGAKAAWEDVSRRYFEAKIPCPFLEDESCSIYPERPMVCREFLVTTPAERCATWGPGVRAVPRLARMGEVMRELGNELLGRGDRDVPLALALEWAEAHGAALEFEGDGEELAMALVQRIQAEDEKGA